MASKGSIVDYLKGQGQDSSYSARQKLARQYGIENYTGTAAQNTNLLRQLQNGAGGNNSAGSAPAQAASQPQTVTGPAASTASTTPVNTGVKQSSRRSSTRRSGSFSYDRDVEDYTPNDEVIRYQNLVKQYEADKPEDFQSRYDGQIQTILDSILNREKFEYDMNNDRLYQQYKDAYMRQGQQAMRDTMGNAAALTGGYGSTYAQTAGSQAYDQYLAGLNDKIPELYQLAYQQYQDEGNSMYNQLNALQGLDDVDYSRYRDTVNDYFTDRDYYNSRYNQEYGYDYGQYQDRLAQENWMQQMAYQEYLDELEQANWEEQFAYQQEQDALAQQNWQTEFDYQKEQDALAMELARQKAASSSKGSGSKSSSSGSSKPEKMTLAEFQEYINYIRDTEGELAANKEAKYLRENDWLLEDEKDKKNKNSASPGYSYSTDNQAKYILSMMNRK